MTLLVTLVLELAAVKAAIVLVKSFDAFVWISDTKVAPFVAATTSPPSVVNSP